ncbi:hypothetical protein [Reinekea sp. G2M2-21]|uniref:hypothetical protein n=1 Tax=Reinekea sp. G2M2-21 TaxID=2788942 RepID=UPI0018A9F85F|nr:hypothetical protein [Reinekea sp. G2M2-21]
MNIIIQAASLLLISWALIGLIKDVCIKRPYAWLLENYLSNSNLTDRTVIAALEDIKSTGGCSKYKFRKKVRQAIYEGNK